MISLLPGSPPADTNSAFAILALIANPEAAAKRLAELCAEKQAADNAVKKTQAIIASVNAANAELEKREHFLTTREAILHARELEIAKREGIFVSAFAFE